MLTPKRVVVIIASLLLIILSVNTVKAADNLIPNSSVEVPATNTNLPESWMTGYLWGDLDASYQYLNTGYLSNRSVKVNVTRYTSGDAKWYFAPIAITAGQTYKYSDFYQSNITTHTIVAFTLADQSTRYLSLSDALPANNWVNYSETFTAPPTAVSLTIFHLISGFGYLTTDNFSLSVVSSSFSRGIVSLTFDDGWQSQYTAGLPLLNQYGYKGTFYIISGSVGQPQYMTLSQVKEMFQNSHEIASHTVHHYDLTSLSLSQLDSELSQSLNYLKKKVGRPINNFAYPYGAYNSLTNQEVRKYYQSARSSDEGLNSKTNFNVYNIQAEHITPSTTITQFQSWLDEAKNQKEWLVLMYHQVDNSGSDYSVTPSSLSTQLQAIQSSGLTVRTVNQALNELKPQL